MTEPTPEQQPDAETDEDPRVVIIGPNGMAVSGGKSSGSTEGEDDDDERHVTDLVEQPAKVMRIGSMIRQLLDEVKAAPLDEASRARLASIYDSSINELKSGLAPELIEELERMSSPFASDTPSEAELRIAQAQVVGWLEGLFHGIQTAIYAQQMAARAQLEQMRRALPPGLAQAMEQGHGQPGGPAPAEGGESHRSGGMYL
ncbi:MAG TPA: bacterial proteasome activator family protein [Marmoricola sp.]|nr:bacterial proteasome activator family protein [Marmoricola sp.]